MRTLPRKRGYAFTAWAFALVVITVLWCPGAAANVLAKSFVPRGFGLLWTNQPAALDVVSDSVTLVSYLAIALTLAAIVIRQRKVIPFAWLFVAFSLLIVSCGFTYALDVVGRWTPLFGLVGAIKLITAIESFACAVLLPAVAPKVSNLVTAAARSRENERRFLNAAASGSNAFFILESVRDAAGEIVDFRYLFVNANGAKILSTTPEALTGRLVCETYPLYRTNGRFETYKRVCSTGEANESEYEPEGGYAAATWVRVQTVKLDDGVSITVTNISEGKENETQLVRLAALMQSTIASSPFATIMIDLDGKMTLVNPAAEKMFGYAEHDLIGGASPLMLFDPTQLAERARTLSEEVKRPVEPGMVLLTGSRVREWTLKRKDGAFLHAEVTVRTLRAPSGVVGLMLVAYDLTERKAHQERIEHLALHDALTGLPTRTLFYDRLNVALAHARREKSKVAVLILDLDDFKRVNDLRGHRTGDDLLVYVAEHLRNSVRASDTVGRMGGDEFVLILADLHTAAEAERIAEKVLSKIRGPVVIGTDSFTPTASIGISLYPEDGDVAEELMKNADTAMYLAKAEGRDAYRAFNYVMAKASARKQELEVALGRALIEDEFELMYQPQVDLSTGMVSGVEALLRWRSSKLGLVMPTEFVPLIEASGLVIPIGEWVVRTACREGRRLQLDLGRSISIGVNVSSRQFQHQGLPRVIREALTESHLEPRCLELEMTESLLVTSSPKVRHILDEVRSLGTRLAIDDFGTGFSSMSYIMRFPVDRIKIDQSFIRDITLDAVSGAVTTAIIALANGLHVGIIAEGVETADQREVLIAMGCTEAQGFYFSTPVRVHELADKIDEIERAERLTRKATRSEDDWSRFSKGAKQARG